MAATSRLIRKGLANSGDPLTLPLILRNRSSKSTHFLSIIGIDLAVNLEDSQYLLDQARFSSAEVTHAVILARTYRIKMNNDVCGGAIQLSPQEKYPPQGSSNLTLILTRDRF